MSNQNRSLDEALSFAISGYPDKSEELLRAIPNEDPRALFNLGWHDMRHGNLLKGFHGMNVGRFLNVFGSPAIPGPIWRDEPLEGKTLLFRSEGGLGDEIINFRFAQEFKDKGAQVIVAGHPSLLPIFARHGFPCVTNDVAEKNGVCYDYWVPAMSAAYILEHQFDTLPGNAYLQAEPVPLAKKPNTIKVGLRWSGNPQFEHEQHRRFNPQLMIDLYKTNGITCFSFQKDNDLQDVPFEDLSSELKTWEDTASHLMAMDLVITSCTSVAHMAGALGIETWVIVPVLPYYTWAVPGEKSAWYDSVTIFRQTKYGHWDDVFEKIQDRLQERLKQKEAA